MYTKENFISLVDHSKLNLASKNLWLKVVQASSDDQLEPIYDVLEKDAKHFDFFDSIFQKKFFALSSGNQNLLDSIIEEEKNYLKNLA